jgi:hypothetical protein
MRISASKRMSRRSRAMEMELKGRIRKLIEMMPTIWARLASL